MGGGDALERAGARADELRARGDAEGWAVMLEVAVAIVELKGKQEGEVH